MRVKELVSSFDEQVEYNNRLMKLVHLRREISKLSNDKLEELRNWLRNQNGIYADERVARKSSREDD